MTDDRERQRAQLQSEIAALQQAIPALAALPSEQERLRVQLADKERQLAMLQAAPSVGSVSATRDVNIATQQTIYNFFGGAPSERGETLLMDYLAALELDCGQLRLARLRERRQSGAE